MTHDPLCDWWTDQCEATNCRGQQPWTPCKHDECLCDLITKVRADERSYILNAAADEITNHRLIESDLCSCLSYVSNMEAHRDWIIREYTATAINPKTPLVKNNDA